MAGELESLHSDEPLDARIARHNYDRLLMLSDGVFAIAITLLALDLKLPLSWSGSLQELADATGRPLVGYLFGFALVGAFWVMHRRLFARLVEVDAVLTILNLLMLGLVGLAPFVARMVAEAGPGRALAIYFLVLGSVLTAGMLMRLWAAWRPRLLHPLIDRRLWLQEAALLAVGAIALLAVGGMAAVTGRPVGIVPLLLLVLGVAGGRRFLAYSQRSSTSRP